MTNVIVSHKTLSYDTIKSRPRNSSLGCRLRSELKTRKAALQGKQKAEVSALIFHFLGSYQFVSI